MPSKHPDRRSPTPRSVEREHRRIIAERDAAIYAESDDARFDRLAAYTSRLPLDDLD